MIPLIQTAIGLAQFAPKIIGLLDSDRGSKASEIAQTVTTIAKSVTGLDNARDAQVALGNDPELALQFELAVMADKTVLERLDEQSRERATEQYKVNNKQADKIAERVTKYNLLYVAFLVVVNIAAVKYFEEDGPLIAVVSNLIGIVIGRLLEERQAIISFFYGSSHGSKLKTISMQVKQ